MIARPTFAVVIPTYNRARLLMNTVTSVLNQEEPAREIIVVDNCSTDETPEVVEELMREHSNVRFFRHEENLERAASRNTGMDHAQSDYVTLLDSDDLMYPHNLREAADFASATGARCFHNLYEVVDESGKRLRGWHFPSLRNQHKAIAEGNFLSCIGTFLHRDIYATYRFDTDPALTGSEDWEFWLRVAADHEIQRIPRVNSGIVHHEQRTMTQQDLATAEKRMEYILEKVETDPHLRKVYGRYRRMMRSSRHVFLGGIANDNRTPGPAFDHLRRALIAYPRIVGNWRFLRTLQLAFLNKMSG